MSWTSEFFLREGSTKEKTKFEPKWSEYDADNDTETYSWDYFDIPGGDLGKREVRTNKNLLNPYEFAKYWQTGSHKGFNIYQAPDLDGDDIPDLVAVNKEGKVVGFNDRYVTKDGVAETPYRRDYYNLSKEERKGKSYQQFLMAQNNKDGWKDLTKFKESKGKAVHNIVKNYLTTELNGVGATEKEQENICKKLVDMISTTFFEPKAPAYQIKVIKSSPEFKKVLKKHITMETIPGYLPEGIKQQLAKSMLNAIRGYGDGGFKNWLMTQYAGITGNRLAVANVNALYSQILAKSAAAKLYKEHGITPMFLVEHPEKATEFQSAVKTKMTELDNEHKMAKVNLEFK